MPLLADTIVECGRRTLTNAINMANAWGRDPKGRWRNIEVIYGDTDSVFIKLPGRSVEEAFLFGDEFCKAVTDSNPPPIQLKLEKVDRHKISRHISIILTSPAYFCGFLQVYLGCLMQTVSEKRTTLDEICSLKSLTKLQITNLHTEKEILRDEV